MERSSNACMLHAMHVCCMPCIGAAVQAISTSNSLRRTIGAGLLIDDNPSYAVECAAAGIHVLLYDWNLSYPWSKLSAE